MFEAAELGQKLSKKEYDAREGPLRVRLLEAQAALRTAGFPVVVVIAGVEGAGTGATVNQLHEWLDPRYLRTQAFGPPSDEEAERPEAWRYWRALPASGLIGIFFGSWYTQALEDLSDARFERVRAFERLLVDDGALLVKLWFHISKRAQGEKLDALMADPHTRWRVTKAHRRSHRHYDDERAAAEEVLAETSTGDAPRTIVDGEDPRARAIFVGEHLADVLEARLAMAKTSARKTPPEVDKPAKREPARALTRARVLDHIEQKPPIDDDTYEADLAEVQEKLARRWIDASARGRSALVVLEGPDAAGKGGAIRRVTSAIDARTFEVAAISAPSEDERAHHYLWRFWRVLPRAGHLTIFDRSWYGRVLVERVEGFATEVAWRRSYAEINDFEEQLDERGIVVVKLWLQIDKDEQAKRFHARETTAFKRYKLTEEDRRNRGKWDAYAEAAEDMIERTSTRRAPWHLVAANDKHAARMEVVQQIARALKHRG